MSDEAARAAPLTPPEFFESNEQSGARWAGGIRLEALGNLTHELRTPLQVILGYLDILRKEFGSEFGAEAHRILERMNTNAHHLAQTVENLIDFAAGPGEEDASVEQSIEIGGLIAELIPAFEAANRDKGLRLVFDSTQAQASIRSRLRPLRLIVQNLVLNAIRFTAAGSVTLIARQRCFGPQRCDGIELEVTDTGPGMTTDQLRNACASFRQLSRSSTRQFRGIGLGLAVVRHNVAALDGTMQAQSTPGAGTTFLIGIPATSGKAGMPPAGDEFTARRSDPGRRRPAH